MVLSQTRSLVSIRGSNLIIIEVKHMKSFKFLIKYYLDSLQIKKNSLFNHIRVYIALQDTKTLIAQGKQTEGNQVIFETTFQEDSQILSFNQEEDKYESYFVTFLLQFEAEGRFIKMGETCIDIGSIANTERNSEIVAYRIDKCFDRNARLLMNISLSYAEEVRVAQTLYESISKSTYQLPLGSNSKKQRHNVNKTEYFELEEHRENYSMISEPRTSFNNQKIERKSIEKTETRNVYQQNCEINQLNQELAAVSTDFRLTKQELAAVEAKYCELLLINEHLQQELRQSHTQNYKMANICDQLEQKVGSLERTLDNQREVSSSEAQKYLILYQESEQVRNKLLLQMDSIKDKERERFTILQIKATEQENNLKKNLLQKEELKERFQLLMAQTQNLQKSHQNQKSINRKLQEENHKLKQTLQTINKDNQQMHMNLSVFKTKNDELQHQLELCRFSITELEKELSDVRHKMDQKKVLIQRWEKEIENANQVINEERFKYNQQIQRIQEQTQVQQRDVEQYIEQLQSKTVNELTKINEMTQLRKQITLLNKKIAEEQDRYKQLQNQFDNMTDEREKSENLLKQEHKRSIELTKDKTQLQAALKQAKEDFMEMSLKIVSPTILTEERDIIIKKCQAERDQYWQNEVDKVETDTLILIEKWKKQNEQHTIRIQQLEVELNSREDENNQLNDKIKALKLDAATERKKLQLQESTYRSLEVSYSQKQTQLWQKGAHIQELLKRLSSFDGIEESLEELQNKIASKKKELTVAKNNFERQKSIRIKQKVEIKEIVLAITSVLNKSEKYKIYYEQLRSETIESDIMNMLNSSFKLYCDKHNKVKQKLQHLETVTQDLENKEREFEKLSNSRKIEKKMSITSSKESLKGEFQIDQQIYSVSNLKQKQVRQIREENLATVNLLKQQNQDLRQKIQKESNKVRDLEKEAQRLEKALQNYQYDIKKMAEDIDNKSDEIADLNLKLTNKENQLHIIKEQLKDTTSELTMTKNRVDELNRILQQEKNKNLFKKGTSLLSSPSKSEQASMVKASQLQKKLKAAQQELQRAKREKQDRKREQVPYLKQTKQLEIKLKEKENIILQIKKEVEVQKSRFEQEKEFFLSREKKMKRDHEEEIQDLKKYQKEIKDKIADEQEKGRLFQKKIKQLQESLKASNAQVTSTFEKEEKTKRMINTEWELKVKSIQIEHKNEQAVLKRMLEEQKSSVRSLRETIQQKEMQIVNLRNDLEKKELKIQDLKAELEVYTVKIRNFEDEEGQYKQTIQVLQNRIKIDSARGSKKNIQKEDFNFQQKSQFSLRAFTFR